MTFEEFSNEYARLENDFKKEFGSDQRKILIAERVLMLKHSWWKRLVDRIIIQNNPRLDIDEAARAERLSQASNDLVNDTNAAIKSFKEKLSDGALDSFLKDFGANSLWDAIQKTKQ